TWTLAQAATNLRAMAQQRRLNWTDNPPGDWSERQTKRVADEVNRLRGKRSAQWLADQTKKLGYEVSRSLISDLENGRRRYVTTAELIILAAALNTSPVALMYPGPYLGEIDALPHVELTKLHAAQWFSGIEWYADSAAGDRTESSATWRSEHSQLHAFRELADLRWSRGKATTRVINGEDTAKSEVAMYDKMIRELEHKLGIGDDA
ncbi:helix-turn-helix domain-containing protein, partial [Mycobacteroides abscessus]|uniref:helix-turn-helix domain-containing protein n=2 Tax=Mycobacteroides abscessus TaxID=36809 RepID=UPI000ACFF126